MNLPLFFRVLRRFRFVILAGFLLAITLATASVAKLEFTHASPSLVYRQQPTWQSTTRLFVTQKGFPWGRLVLSGGSQTAGTATGKPATSGLQFADPNRLVGLALIYAQLINSDPIQSQIRRIVPRNDALSAAPVRDPATGSPLPLVDVISVAHSPDEAVRVSKAGAKVFRSYIDDQEASGGIAPDQRVLLQVVSTKATLIAGRKKTNAILVFFATMIATVGVALVLENLRPGIDVTEPAAPKPAVPEQRVVA